MPLPTPSTLLRTLTLLALGVVGGPACTLDEGEIGDDLPSDTAISADEVRSTGCSVSARLVELSGPIERPEDIPVGADGRPRDTGGRAGAYFAFGIDVKNESKTALGAVRLRQWSWSIGPDGSRREIARVARVIDFPGSAKLGPGQTLPIRSVMVRPPGQQAFFGRNRVRFEFECGDGSVEPAVVEFDTVRPQSRDQRLSCGDVAAREGFGAPRCEHNGNRACAGRRGFETFDCVACCDGG